MKHLLIAVFFLVLMGCQNAGKSNIDIVKQYVRAVESKDSDTMEKLLADSYIGYGPSSNHTIDKPTALAQWKKHSTELYDKIEYTRAQYANVTITDGPNKGDWVSNWADLTIQYLNDKGSVRILANTVYQIENGQIVKTYTFYNEADVLRQLGYVFINPDEL